MTSTHPNHALNLDSVQQQNFVKYHNSLPEKPPTTVRIFDRNDYYTVHGIDATTAAKEVFSSVSNIKKMGIKPNTLDYLVLSKGNFETCVKKLLLPLEHSVLDLHCWRWAFQNIYVENLAYTRHAGQTAWRGNDVRRYRIEIYVAEGSIKNCDWELRYKGSPGYMSQLEEILGEGLSATNEASTPCLMAVNIKTDPITKGRLLGVACISTAEYQLSVTEFTDDDLLTQLETVTVQMAPTECLIPQSDTDEYKALKKVMERASVAVTKCKKSEFSTEGLIQDLNRLLKFKDSQQQDANAFAETRNTVAMTSLAASIKYSELLTDETNFGRFKINTVKVDCFLHVDAAALSALNTFPELGDNSQSPSRSLYGLLDRCRTAHGKRLLAQWLRQPLRDINLINERLDVVEVLVNNSQLRLQLHEDHLRRIPDLQALARRLTRKKANLQDCYKIYQAISRLPHLLQCLSEADHSTVHSSLAEPISELNEDVEKYKEMIEATVDIEAVEKGDFLVKSSFDEQLESLRVELQKLQTNAEKELNKAARELGLEGGKTIKLDNNPQNGFHFRVTLKEEQTLRGNKKFTIIDAVKGGVRFKNHALESITEDYIETKNTYEKEQDKVVAEIVGIAAGYSECLFCLSHIISRLDVLVAFSMAASTAPSPYCRPQVVESLDQFVLKEARHPCLELQEGVSYIPNDVEFKRGECIMHIVTGANMGGKSTWMRSAGASVLLAHAGSFVPCSSALIPRLRSLAARVGASDREQAGQSTFMLEMIETAAILRTATADSLVLVDELGRGTSTYEGCGIAWAIAEELATKCQCFCLFATHYHELTRLASSHRGLIVNSHAEAEVVRNQLVLLHRIEPGPALNSLGLHVAKLADLPDSVIKYAEAKQAQLETNLFDANYAETNQETAEGEKIIVNYLKKCKEIQENTQSDEEMIKLVKTLTEEVRQTSNTYVQRLLK